MARSDFPHLLAPGHIGSLRIKNRVVMSPLSTGYAARDGTVTPRLLKHYQERAKGGVGLVICEYSYIDTKFSKANNNQLGVYDEECMSGIGRLADGIQDSGARAGVQISHVGLQNFVPGLPRVAPSYFPFDRLGAPTTSPARELTIGEIEEIIDAYGQAARRVKMAGFDLVELNGAHGYLINQFLSPLTNQRSDDYGGDLKGRLRFVRNVIESVRGYVGRDFALSIRLSHDEYLEGGLVLADTIQIAQAVAEAGVDVIHVSCGIHKSTEWTVAPTYSDTGINVEAAGLIRVEVPVPVMVVGSITSPQQAERVLSEQKADFITLGRALLADPHIVRKIEQGDVDDVRPCIRGNDGCQDRRATKGSVHCSVNFVVGRQDEFGEVIERSENAGKRIAVVGGGPAGLEAARVAALRGHSVVMFEQQDRLGGWLATSSLADFKVDFRRYLQYLIRQVEQSKVEILQEAATASNVSSVSPDLVILATGSVPVWPELLGVDRADVILASSVFGDPPEGRRIAVAGCDLISIEAALHLAKRGAKVDLLHEGAEFGPELSRTSRLTLKRILEEAGAEVHFVARVEGVDESHFLAVGEDGADRKFPADAFVVWGGLEPLSGLQDDLEAEGLLVTAVGDCVRPRKIYDAVSEGHIAARRI